MILPQAYYMIIVLVFWYFEFPEIWIVAMFLCAVVYNCGHMIVKELKK